MLTSSLLTELLCSLSIIGGLLLLGTFLRAKVKLFQKLFLPASVIGGFIGLLLGPMVVWVIMPFSGYLRPTSTTGRCCPAP